MTHCGHGNQWCVLRPLRRFPLLLAAVLIGRVSAARTDDRPSSGALARRARINEVQRARAALTPDDRSVVVLARARESAAGGATCVAVRRIVGCARVCVCGAARGGAQVRQAQRQLKLDQKAMFGGKLGPVEPEPAGRRCVVS